MQNELPEWAVSAADEVWTALANNEASGREAETDLFARALVAAERRGIEMAAGFHDEQAALFEKFAFQELSVSIKLRDEAAAEQHRNVATAIRQLGETT